MKRSLFVVLIMVALLAPALPVGAQERNDWIHSFRPLTTFVVPGGGVAEIVSATPDGNLLAYTNAGDGEVGLVDITNPLNPVQIASVSAPGESNAVPTSVSIVPDGTLALAVFGTSSLEEGAAPIVTPGLLVAIALPSGEVLGQLEIGDGPDSISTAEIDGQLFAVIAIENEPIVVDADGNRTDADSPGDPDDISAAGYVQVIAVDQENISASSVADVTFDEADLTELGLFYPDDPQPEFVDIRDGKAAVSLQENNGIAIIDVASAATERIFSLGVVADRSADLTDDATISFTDVYPADVAGEENAGARFADAVAWSADGTTIYSADEGEQDLTSGRGWSIWSADGTFVSDDGGALEAEAVALGMYPESRSGAKGIEVEGVEFGIFGGREFLFVGSERGSFVAVYRLQSPREPRFIQLLPTGVEPEGLLAIPARNLFLTSDEASGTITIFEGMRGLYSGDVESPTLRSSGVDDPWSALSGLAADPDDADVIYAVPDNALPSSIFRIEMAGNGSAEIGIRHTITIDGEQARYDLEGITTDTSTSAQPERPGYWLAAEGNAEFGEDSYQPNQLVQVSSQGEVLQEVSLPETIDSAGGGLIQSNGFEGVAVSDDGGSLVAAIQREYTDDEANDGTLFARIARYNLQAGGWEFFLYPLDPTTVEDDWVGLSEIINLGNDRYAVIERDKQVGGAAEIKKVYAFSLDGVQPHDGLVSESDDLSGKVISKTELVHVLEEFTPFEKVEGLTVTADGNLWAVLDNDGGSHTTILENLGLLTELE